MSSPAIHSPATHLHSLQALLRHDHTLIGGVVVGVEGHAITAQARAIRVEVGDWEFRTCVTISGMARGALAEARDRIVGAFAKYRLLLPPVEVIINLAPADLPKEGAWLDLVLATLILQASGVLPDLPAGLESTYLLVGELGLHGEVRRVSGVLPIAAAGVAAGCRTIIVPVGNERECALLAARHQEELQICAVSNLEELISFFRGQT